MTIYAQTISTPSQLRDAFREYDRDQYPAPLYDALFDYLDTACGDEPYILDVIGICCDLNETTPQEFQTFHAGDCPDPTDYYHLGGFDGDTYQQDVRDALEEAVQENACYLYTDPETGTVYYFGELA